MDAVESGEEPVIVSQPEDDINKEELEKELLATEEDIQTLNEALNVKLKRRIEIKKKLGHTDLSTISFDVKEELARIGESEAFRKTTRAFGQARSKTIDVAEDVKEKVNATLQTLKNSETYKNISDSMGSALGTVKAFAMPRLTALSWAPQPR
ncbi:hypothetical protein AAHC03_04606 [Spirometra sp. Aus1]|nr:unnamed protein product [Spirometra erinaceieuropaei]